MKSKSKAIRNVNNWTVALIKAEKIEGESMTVEGESYTVKELFLRAQGGLVEEVLGAYIDGVTHDHPDYDEIARSEIDERQNMLESVKARMEGMIEGQNKLKMNLEKDRGVKSDQGKKIDQEGGVSDGES